MRSLLIRIAFGLAVLTVRPAAASAVAPQKQFLVTDHGAVGDGRTLNTKAIQATIEFCAVHGGGAVVVPAGVFRSGSIFLRQGVNLIVARDAVLKGSENTNDYPWIDTRIAGFEMKWPAALINADGVSGVELAGPGTVDGSGARWWRDYWTARAAEKGNIDPHFKVARPRLVHFIRSTNIVVHDLRLENPAFWNLQLTYCDGVVVSNLTVRAHSTAPRAASSDGIDVDSTCNVLIAACDIACDDDGICLKSGRDADGLRVNRPTENVVIRDCRVGPAAGLVVFGSETSGGIRHVQVLNCRADHGCEEVVRFKTRMGRGGVVEDVLYENIFADGARAVFSFNMDSFSTTWIPESFRAPVPDALGTPVFRNIRVRNLEAKNCASAGRLAGLAQSPLRDLQLENVSVESETGFTVRHAAGLRFQNVTWNGRLLSTPVETRSEVPAPSRVTQND